MFLRGYNGAVEKDKTINQTNFPDPDQNHHWCSFQNQKKDQTRENHPDCMKLFLQFHQKASHKTGHRQSHLSQEYSGCYRSYH